jgi:hypothetical protein
VVRQMMMSILWHLARQFARHGCRLVRKEAATIERREPVGRKKPNSYSSIFSRSPLIFGFHSAPWLSAVDLAVE